MTEFVWLTLLALLCLLAVSIVYRRRIFFHLYYQLISRPYGVLRFIRSNTSLVVSLLTVSSVYASWKIGHEAIVTATIFYATSLFLFNILSRDVPFPIIVYDQSYIDSDHGNSDEEGFQYEIIVQNNGEVDLVDPIVEYRLFSHSYCERTDKWTSISAPSRDPLVLEPGDTKRYEIEGEPVTEDRSTDHYLLFRFRPKRRYRDVTLVELFSVGGG